MERITQAIILAAGEGQRLKPFTKLTPKVMLPVAGKPILQYTVEALAQNGIRRMVMVVGYRKEQIQNYFGSGQDFGVEIEYVFQPQQLGTGHALAGTRGVADDRFLVVSGDNIVDAETIAPLVTVGANTVLVKMHPDTSRYDAVKIQDGLVTEIIETPSHLSNSLVNTGTYVLTREVFDFIGDEPRLTYVIRRMISEDYPIAAYETKGLWLDAAYPWDLLTLNDLILLNKLSPSIGGTVEDGVIIKGSVSVGEGTVIRANSYIVGPAIIGDNCEIGPGVCIFPSTSIGDGVVVAPFSIIKNSVIWDKATIGPSSSIQDSVIALGATVGSHFAAQSAEADVLLEDGHHRVKMGCMAGSYSQIGDNVIVEPGNIVGNDCHVKGLKVISQNIPDGGMVI